MSVAIAVKGKKKGVFLGADSAIISADENDQTIARVDPSVNPKIMKSGPYILAGVGSPRILNVLRYIDWPKLPAAAKKSLGAATKHVVNEMLPVLQDAYHKHQIPMEQIPGATIYHGQFILAFGDYVFDVGPELSVVTYETPFIALGGAAKIATGALYVATAMLDEPEDILKMALEATAHHSTLCTPPFTIMSTAGAQ